MTDQCYHLIETSTANQPTGFYMMGKLVVNELKFFVSQFFSSYFSFKVKKMGKNGETNGKNGYF